MVFVSFSMPLGERSDLRRMSRKLGCANVEILLAELVKIGKHVMEQRFEPAPKSQSVRARAALRARR